jgi:hypothetical protein
VSSHSLHHRHAALGLWASRIRKAPAHASRTPELAQGERVLYRAPRTTSGVVVATTAALRYRPSDGAWRYVEWADVDDVRWSTTRATLTLRSCVDERRVHHVPADRTLAALAEDRVAHAHLIRRRVEIAPGISGIVEAVLPADDAVPVWRVLLDDPDLECDPATAHACRDAIDAVRAVAD